MQNPLDQASRALKAAADKPPKEAMPFLETIRLSLEAEPPGRERDGLLALVHLRSAQALRTLGHEEKAQRAFMLGFSYARTSGEQHVRRLAEHLQESFV